MKPWIFNKYTAQFQKLYIFFFMLRIYLRHYIVVNVWNFIIRTYNTSSFHFLSRKKNIKKNQQSGGQSKKYCMANSKSKKSIGICPREYLDNSLIFYKREEKTPSLDFMWKMKMYHQFLEAWSSLESKKQPLLRKNSLKFDAISIKGLVMFIFI